MPDYNRNRDMERIVALLANDATHTQPLGSELAWLHQQYQRLERKFTKVAHISDLMQNHLKESQESLLLSIQAAKATEIAQNRFIADVSHEVRTPLGGILTAIELLDEQETDPRKKGLLQLALGAAESLLRLTNGILDLSRIDAGKQELCTEDFRLDQLLDRLIQLYTLAARGKDLTIGCECPPEIPRWLHGDALKLEQILRNLLDNAVKFTPSGNILLRVAKGCSGDADALVFSVEDSGDGIAAADLPHIFDSYRQGQIGTGRNTRGTGLGLAITRRLVELMGGEISVRSRLKHGSVFSFTLPLVLAEEEQLLPVTPMANSFVGQENEPGASIATPRPPLGILLADDHRLFREILTAMLEGQPDLQVVAGAGTGTEVLAATCEHRPDILLLDLHFGAKSGFDLIPAIREASPDTRIVILTSDDSSDSLRRAVELGVDGYLLKTLPVQELLQALHAVANGDMVLPTALKRHTGRTCPLPERPLSPRETEILQLLALGKSNPEIASITGTSENTVKSHVRALMEKLGAHNRVLLLATATRLGLLSPQETSSAT